MQQTTPENDTPSWRDLADQLTRQQIAELESCAHSNKRTVELRYAENGPRWVDRGPRWDDDALLHKARDYAEENLSDALYAHVPPPAGVVDLWGHWADEGDGIEQRRFDGASRRIELRRGEDALVTIWGSQYPDGHADREIRLCNSDSDATMTLAQARQLGHAILDACNEAQQMNNCDPTVVDA
jgi:hypothetical protein